MKNYVAEIQRLKDEGYKVRINHFRFYQVSKDKTDGYLLLAKYEVEDISQPLILSPNGGETVVVIEDKVGDVVASGTSGCSMKDVYNKRIGLRIALGRAIKELGKK